MARYREKESFISVEAVDLTPLIDCVFQLLIFFMVTTAFIHARGLDVDLPGASQATEQQEKKDINIIVIPNCINPFVTGEISADISIVVSGRIQC